MKLSSFIIICALFTSQRVSAQTEASPSPGPPPISIKDGRSLDAIVAVVGKHPIFKSSIDAQTQLFLLQRGVTNIPPDTLMDLRKQVLESEVDQKLLLAKADEDSIVVTDQQVDDQLDGIIKGYVARLGSVAEVERQFGKSIPELKASPDLRERTRENLIVQQERYKVVPPSQSISRPDVLDFYKLYKDSLPVVGAEVELATIVKLVKPLPNQKELSLKFAKSLVDSLRQGADFALLARRYSQHSTAATGGDLGAFYSRGTFLPAYEEAAFKLKPGEVTDVIQTDQGFYIVKLLERRGEEIHVAQILIKPTINSMDEAAVRDSLLIIRDSAIKGEDFAQLAEKYSDDAETKSFGGDLGHIRIEDLAAEQRQVVDSLDVGGVSLPIHIGYSESRTGFQIVKLIKKIPEHKISPDGDYRELEAAALQWKQQQDLTKWLAHARTTVYLDVRDISSYY